MTTVLITVAILAAVVLVGALVYNIYQSPSTAIGPTGSFLNTLTGTSGNPGLAGLFGGQSNIPPSVSGSPVTTGGFTNFDTDPFFAS